MWQFRCIGSGLIFLEVLNEAPAEPKCYLKRLKLCLILRGSSAHLVGEELIYSNYISKYIIRNTGVGRHPRGYSPRSPKSGVTILCIS